jgi:Uracil DNA glycosylase superfamily/3'-5' exonuclease
VPDPFAHSLGPKTAKLAVVAEAWGEHEDMFKAPLVWWSGVELARMFNETHLGPPIRVPYGGIEPFMISHWLSTGHFYTNVFAERPPNNELDNWCVAKKDLPKDYNLPAIKQGRYIRPEFLHHVERLYVELNEVKPNLILALGGISCWALMGVTGITKLRGAITWGTTVPFKILPTYHPAYILRVWQQRTVVLQDLLKADRERAFPELRRPERWLIIDPTLEDIREWMRRPATHYACDIETDRGQITMIGFARSKSDAIVIPFIKGGKSYWSSHEDEVRAWYLVKELLEGDKVKIFQNGLFDLSYIAHTGIRPRNCTEDLMLLHHALFPEMRKGLGFLGSVYTNEIAWKLARDRPKDQMNKREE